MHTMDKILPVQQSLIPVSFKRRLQYKGHYIEEYIDKEKLLAYFNWFKYLTRHGGIITYDKELF